jgi:hypothetical protein
VEKLPKENLRTMVLTMRRNFLHHGEPLPTGAKEYLLLHFPGTSRCASLILII